MIVVTGATGQLGRLVVKSLLKSTPASQVVAAVRTPSKAADLAALGVQIREADYGKPDTLTSAFAGATNVLLVSSTNIGQRIAEHKAVIDAAKSAGAQLLAYTSVLRADTSTLLVAPDHLATEQYLAASGVPWVFLRNGWYLENYTGGLSAAVEHEVIMGSAAEGRIAAASRADYAEAAAAVLSTPGHAGKTYELGGDSAFTLAELATEVSKQSGKTIAYKDMPEPAYEDVLRSAGLPDHIAHLLADSDEKASLGELYTTSRDLNRLLGRSTTSLATAVAAAIAK